MHTRDDPRTTKYTLGTFALPTGALKSKAVSNMTSTRYWQRSVSHAGLLAALPLLSALLVLASAEPRNRPSELARGRAPPCWLSPLCMRYVHTSVPYGFSSPASKLNHGQAWGSPACMKVSFTYPHRSPKLPQHMRTASPLGVQILGS